MFAALTVSQCRNAPLKKHGKTFCVAVGRTFRPLQVATAFTKLFLATGKVQAIPDFFGSFVFGSAGNEMFSSWDTEESPVVLPATL